MHMITQLLEKFLGGDSLEGSLLSRSSPPPVLGGSTTSVQPTTRRLPSSEIPGLDAIDFDDVDLRRMIVAETAERKAKRMTGKAGRLDFKAKYLEMLENLERIILDLRSSESMLQGDAEVLASTLEKLKRRKCIVEDEMVTLMLSKIRHGPRTCLFYLKHEDGRERELLTSLRAHMEDVCLMFLCEEPGHQHFVDSCLCWDSYRVLREDRLQKRQPLLGSGLQVVARAMNTFAGQLTHLDSVTLAILGSLRWDLRAIDVASHRMTRRVRTELKRAEDSAAEWVLGYVVDRGSYIYKEFRLHRVRCKVTEEGAHEVRWLGYAMSI